MTTKRHLLQSGKNVPAPPQANFMRWKFKEEMTTSFDKLILKSENCNCHHHGQVQEEWTCTLRLFHSFMFVHS